MIAFGPGVWHRIEGIMDQHVYKFNLIKLLVVYNHALQFGSKQCCVPRGKLSQIHKRVQEWLKLQPFRLSSGLLNHQI